MAHTHLVVEAAILLELHNLNVLTFFHLKGRQGTQKNKNELQASVRTKRRLIQIYAAKHACMKSGKQDVREHGLWF